MNNQSLIIAAIGAFVALNVLPSDNLEEVMEDDEETIIEGQVTVDPETFEVTVPSEKIGDIYRYDYHIFMELYHYNETEGEEVYTLTADGTLSIQIQGLETAEDGFKQNHECLAKQEVTSATAQIVIDTKDSEPFVTHASGTATRAEFWNLDDERVVKAETDGVVNIDEIPRAPNIPLKFTGNLRAYPDPNEILEDSLDETIYLDEQILKLNDSGVYTEPGANEWLDQNFDWKVDAVENISGYNSMRINVTAKVFYNWLNFNRLIWVTNEVPVPVKGFTRTNQSWGEEGETDEWGYMVAETTRTLRNGSAGFTQGTESPQWRNKAGDYVQEYPGVEKESWEYMPEDGSRFDDTHFQMRPSAAIEYAKENSEELKEYLELFDNGELICNSAYYNFTKTPKDKTDTERKAGTYYWNLTFGVRFDWWEEEEEKDEDGQSNRNRSYNILVKEVIEKNVISGYTSTFSIPPEQDRGRRRGGASYYRSELDSEAVTLSSSISIFKQDKVVADKAFDNQGNMDDEFKYGVLIEAMETEERPVMDLVGTLTGINTPSARFGWWLQQDTIFESGETFAAALDAETGQLLFILEADGTQLNTIFT